MKASNTRPSISIRIFALSNLRDWSRSSLAFFSYFIHDETTAGNGCARQARSVHWIDVRDVCDNRVRPVYGGDLREIIRFADAGECDATSDWSRRASDRDRYQRGAKYRGGCDDEFVTHKNAINSRENLDAEHSRRLLFLRRRSFFCCEDTCPVNVHRTRASREIPRSR